MSDSGDWLAALGTTFKRIIRSLRIPNSGNPPYWFVGTPVPPELIAFYAPSTVMSVMLAYTTATSYQYTAWISDIGFGTAAYAQGWVNSGVVSEMFYQKYDPAGQPKMQMQVAGALQIPDTNTPPYMIFGDNTPAVLATFYAGRTIVLTQISFATGSSYHYTLWATDGTSMMYAQGWVNAGTVYEMFAQVLRPGSSHPGPNFTTVSGSFQIPGGSANPPYMIFGVDIPTALATFYAGSGTVIAAQVTYAVNGNDYHYTVWVYAAGTGDWTYAQGFNSGGTIYETFTQFQDVTNQIRNVEFGDTSGGHQHGSQYFFSGATGSATAHLMNPGAVDYSKVQLDDKTDFLLDFTSQSRGIIGQNFKSNGNTGLTVLGAERAITSAEWQSEPTYTFRDSRLYRIDVDAHIFPNTANDSTMQVLVRLGQATVVGTVLGQWEVDCEAAANNQTHQLHLSVHVYRAAGAGDLNSKLSLTCQPLTGAAQCGFASVAAVRPITITVTDVGNTYTSPLPIIGMQTIA